MFHRTLRIGSLAVLASAFVAGCGPDTGVPVSHSPAEEPPPQSPPPANPPPATNRAPTISGTPSLSLALGSSWRFAPTAFDADGDTLVWSISGKPADAVFSPSSGTLDWTPSQAGTWPNIVVTVTDSKGASASTGAFALVVAAPASTGSAALSWSSPGQYTDGSSLPATDLAAYRIYVGTSTAALNRVAEVDGRTTSFIAGNLAPGTHYFAVTAVAANGSESSFSEIGSKTVL